MMVNFDKREITVCILSAIKIFIILTVTWKSELFLKQKCKSFRHVKHWGRCCFSAIAISQMDRASKNIDKNLQNRLLNHR